jgi:hypothetical protein
VTVNRGQNLGQLGVSPVPLERRSTKYLARFLPSEIAKWAGPIKASPQRGLISLGRWTTAVMPVCISRSTFNVVPTDVRLGSEAESVKLRKSSLLHPEEQM